MPFQIVTTIEHTGKAGDDTFVITLDNDTQLVCTSEYVGYPTTQICLAPSHWPENVQDSARDLFYELVAKFSDLIEGEVEVMTAWLVTPPKIGDEGVKIRLRYGVWRATRELTIPGTIVSFD